ncbi:MAG: DUF4363 family protein [Peptococcaceae bacterium]|nr:DUF4363 family protein [Peptococcaceae bacterium]
MRATVIIVLGFIILFGCSTAVSYKVNTTAVIIDEGLKQAVPFIETDQWDKASQIINNNYQNWLKAKQFWALFINHNTLNNVEISFQKLNQLILHREKSFSLAELEALRILIRDIPETERLKLINIF